MASLGNRRRRGTVRLYDKDFNLLATWGTDDTVYLAQDYEDGHRSAGPVTSIDYAVNP